MKRLGWDAVIAAMTAALVCAGYAPAASHARMHMLTAGKIAWFENRGDIERNGGIVVVGRDRALRTLYDPTCPTVSVVEVEAYLQSTARDAVLAHVELDCSKWSRAGSGFQYGDASGTVRSIRYTRSGLQIEVRGPGFTPIDGAVGFVQAQLQIGDELLRARFHNFRQNDAQVVRSRRPSLAAAMGEAGFWDVLLGDDSAEAREQQVVGILETAVRRTPRDGRSQFLLAMLHLYRFGQRVARLDAVSAEARAELSAANGSFAAALPLLWNDATATGDSRVPGFAAAAKYMQGVVEDDDALRAEGLADLERSIAVNSFFNVFDFIPAMQFLPPSDPVFERGFTLFTAYLEDPDTLRCVGTQPEICANAGLAPRNIQGALTLFGDLYAKAGNLERAQFWYNLVGAFPDTATWQFAALLADRRANAAARVALYGDGDPSNDPPLVGAGAEACSICHVR